MSGITRHSNEKQESERQRCPRCGGELKRMRCRIDATELYCPSCRFSLDACRSEKEGRAEHGD